MQQPDVIGIAKRPAVPGCVEHTKGTAAKLAHTNAKKLVDERQTMHIIGAIGVKPNPRAPEKGTKQSIQPRRRKVWPVQCRRGRRRLASRRRHAGKNHARESEVDKSRPNPSRTKSIIRKAKRANPGRHHRRRATWGRRSSGGRGRHQTPTKRRSP